MKFGVNPEYVMDKMTFVEINSLFKFSYYKNQEEWEQTRFLGYIQVRSVGSKIGKMTDLVQFPWEKPNKSTPQIMSDKDFNRLQDKAKWMIENNIFE